jgi:rare lipoprotein A
MRIIVILLVAVLVASCSSEDLTKSYARFKEGVKVPFYQYNYRSNLNTYQPASWRSSEPKRYVHKNENRRENWKNYKVGGPYQISGQWYYPKEDVNYKEVGMASWYGAKFHNKKTANGEIFDRHLMTAAHRTLPLPSMVRVTNLENGRSVLVRVNDRGPFAKDRIIDMSERAAAELGFHEQGTTRVKVEFDRKATENLFYDPWEGKEEAKPKMAKSRHSTSPNKTVEEERVNFFKEHFVQAGAYSTWDNARSAAKGLSAIGPVRILEGDYRGGIVYKVKLGPFLDEKEAGKVLDEVAMMGFGDAIVLDR